MNVFVDIFGPDAAWERHEVALKAFCEKQGMNPISIRLHGHIGRRYKLIGLDADQLDALIVAIGSECIYCIENPAEERE